ncbi:MAG: peptidyl-prolyl cis-trans isomerase [Kiritimatiellae bacterium]|nr:peptidyl-prolyl cis-trans isomerase [Kiritimatiellia bacterium]
MRLNLVCRAAMALCLLPASCARRARGPARDDDVLAQVGQGQITARDLKEAMRRRGGADPSVFAARAVKERLLEELIRLEVLAETARRQGYADQPQVRYKIRQLLVASLEEDLLTATPAEDRVTDNDIAAYYQSQLDRFRIPESIRVGSIKIRIPEVVSEPKRAELADKAKRVRDAVTSDNEPAKAFTRLAAQHSDDQATRYKGGDAGWMGREEAAAKWGRPAADALFALASPGDVPPVLETRDAFYVFRLTGKRPADVLPLDKVRENLRLEIARKRRETRLDTFYQASRKDMPVSVNRGLLERIRPPEADRTPDVQPAAPPPMPER